MRDDELPDRELLRVEEPPERELLRDEERPDDERRRELDRRDDEAERRSAAGISSCATALVSCGICFSRKSRMRSS